MTDEEAIQEAQKGVKLPDLNIPLVKTPGGETLALVGKDPAFQQGLAEITQKFDRNTYLAYEIVWILLIWLFRAWRLTKVNTFLTRIWTQAWIGLVFWVGSLVLVPWVLWGKSYQIVLGSVIRALIHQF